MLVSFWIISRPARSAWLSAKLTHKQPPRCAREHPSLGIAGSSPQSQTRGGGYGRSAWGSGFQLAEHPKLCMDGEAPAKALKWNLCAWRWLMPSQILLSSRMPLLPGCSAWTVKTCVFKMLSGSGSIAPGSDCKCLNLMCMDVLKLSVCVSACRIRTSVINNN